MSILDKSLRIAAVAALALMASGLAATARDTVTERLDDRRMFGSGREAFTKTCARCHTGLDSAVGPNLFQKEYDPEVLKYFARHGFGPMPAFTESMIDNATLDELAAYVARQGKGESR